MVCSGLCPLVIEDVVNEGERIGVRARTPQDMAPCPVCGVSSGRVHGYHRRTVADVPVGGRRVVVRVRRLGWPTPAADTASSCPGCWGRDGRSRWSGLKVGALSGETGGGLDRYQRRTTRLTRQVKAVVKELAGRAGHVCWRYSRQARLTAAAY